MHAANEQEQQNARNLLVDDAPNKWSIEAIDGVAGPNKELPSKAGRLWLAIG
jgi:hypothetical protein